MANYTASDITTDEQAALDQIKEETESTDEGLNLWGLF